MSIFAIGDLHLDFSNEKPMNIFGDNWQGHSEKIRQDWINKVSETDLVILPGDFSWATTLEQTYKEFLYLNDLPGKKILLKGNHDYWWNTLRKMNEYIKYNNFSTVNFLYNNSYCFENYIIVGTRGWVNSGKKEDIKIIKREEIRLNLSIQDGIQKYGKDKEMIVVMHYPPISNDVNFVEIMEKYNVVKCVYGHLHGIKKLPKELNIKSKINFELVSSDYLNFKLVKLI